MTFFKYFFWFLSLESVEMELIGLENTTIDRSLSRKELTKLAFDSISLAYL